MAQLVKLLDYVSRYEHDLIPVSYAIYPIEKVSMGTYEDPMGKWSGFIGMATGNRRRSEEPEEGKWFSPFFRLFGQRKTVKTEEESDNSEDEKSDEEDNFGFNPN